MEQHACKISTAYTTEGPHFLMNVDLGFQRGHMVKKNPENVVTSSRVSSHLKSPALQSTPGLVEEF